MSHQKSLNVKHSYFTTGGDIDHPMSSQKKSVIINDQDQGSRKLPSATLVDGILRVDLFSRKMSQWSKLHFEPYERIRSGQNCGCE